MWRLTCLLLLCFQPYSGFAQFDFGQRISQQIHDSLQGIDNLGSQITANVHQQLAPLQNLGLNIHNQVHHNLMPVYAMTIKNNLANGVGGITVATYYGNQPRSFIIQNGDRSICLGSVQGPNCLGSLAPFDIETQEDFCFATSYASINNRICLSSGPVNVRASNSQLSCTSPDGSPTLILTRKEYRNMCGNRMPWQVLYRYYANPNDPQAIPIPNSNPYVTCNNNEPGVCEFEGTNTGGNGMVYSSSSGMNVFSNSYN